MWCCSHVSSVKLYFSCLKYESDYVWQAEYLQEFFESESDKEERSQTQPSTNLEHKKNRDLNRISEFEGSQMKLI